MGSILELRLDPARYIALIRISLRDDIRLPVDSQFAVSALMMGNAYLSILPNHSARFVSRQAVCCRGRTRTAAEHPTACNPARAPQGSNGARMLVLPIGENTIDHDRGLVAATIDLAQGDTSPGEHSICRQPPRADLDTAKEKTMSEMALRQDIIDELEFEPRVNAAHIGVAVEKGVATLSGHVGSYAEKLAAEKAVKRVKGVQAIAEEIEVRFSSDKKTADDEIAARAVNILRWSAVVPPDSVLVKVQEGRVNLTGQVNWQFQRAAAEAEIRRLSGVVGVLNSVTIKPHVQPVDVKRKIEAALKRNAEIEAQRIRVTVEDGGRVGLDGYVDDWRQREAAVNAAWSAPGVERVDVRLQIS